MIVANRGRSARTPNKGAMYTHSLAALYTDIWHNINHQPGQFLLLCVLLEMKSEHRIQDSRRFHHKL